MLTLQQALNRVPVPTVDEPFEVPPRPAWESGEKFTEREGEWLSEFSDVESLLDHLGISLTEDQREALKPHAFASSYDGTQLVYRGPNPNYDPNYQAKMAAHNAARSADLKWREYHRKLDRVRYDYARLCKGE